MVFDDSSVTIFSREYLARKVGLCENIYLQSNFDQMQ